jgi:hypothetical protein
VLLHTMIWLNDLIHEINKGIVRVVTSSINTYTWLYVLASRDYSCLEWETMLIFGIFVFLPEFWSEMLSKKRFSSCREFRESNNVFRFFKLRAALSLSNSSSLCCCSLLGGSSCSSSTS